MKQTSSHIINEMQTGSRTDDRGVPLGLVNWMVHNNEPHQRPVDVENKHGILHFILWLGGIGMKLHIFEATS